MLDDRYYMRQTQFDARRSATVILLIVNAVAFLVQCFAYGYPPLFPRADHFALSWAGLSRGYVWQLITFQFLHGGLLHLLFNCWAIYFFGREIEQTLGRKSFLILYFGSGIFGGLVQAGAGALAQYYPSEWASHFAAPTVGASAGAFGLMAAFAMLFPERVLTLLLFLIIPVSLRAKFVLLFSALLAIFGILFPIRNIADAAHLGGMIAGILFVRHALHWNWSWPAIRFRRPASARRLVRVSSASSAGWRAKKAQPEDLPSEEFLAKEVDPILDKISAHGLQSLTERERRILEAARERIGKR